MRNGKFPWEWTKRGTGMMEEDHDRQLLKHTQGVPACAYTAERGLTHGLSDSTRQKLLVQALFFTNPLAARMCNSSFAHSIHASILPASCPVAVQHPKSHSPEPQVPARRGKKRTGSNGSRTIGKCHRIKWTD
eukprot:1160058-Pelagomonas_calceolata.AAC.6